DRAQGVALGTGGHRKLSPKKAKNKLGIRCGRPCSDGSGSAARWPTQLKRRRGFTNIPDSIIQKKTILICNQLTLTPDNPESATAKLDDSDVSAA
ncbi:MAG: hypothetical protein K2Q97_20680, partial [Burkholderiaceae bacterium]|nr:hypothetical protein [Burkholderiaceae bacterium]